MVLGAVGPVISLRGTDSTWPSFGCSTRSAEQHSARTTSHSVPGARYSACDSGYNPFGFNSLSVWAWTFLLGHLIWATGFMFLTRGGVIGRSLLGIHLVLLGLFWMYNCISVVSFHFSWKMPALTDGNFAHGANGWLGDVIQ
jgi:Photosystem I psaA/psaB protein